MPPTRAEKTATVNDHVRLLARALKYRHKLDPAEIRALLANVHPGDTAIDLGAHKGALRSGWPGVWARRARSFAWSRNRISPAAWPASWLPARRSQ